MKRFFLFFLLLPSLQLAAQIYTPAQRMLQQAVEPQLVIVASSYRLQDTASGDFFGRRGRDDFNCVYSLAVATTGGLLMPRDAREPWLNDSLFARYSTSHRPHCIGARLRHLPADTAYTDTLPLPSLATSGQLLFMADSSLVDALQCDTATADGWLMWVFVADSASRLSQPSYATYAAQLPEADSSGLRTLRAPQPAVVAADSAVVRRAVGAVYLMPLYEAGGAIRLVVGGLAVRYGGGWALAPVRMVEPSRSSADDELTPVPRRSKRRGRR